MVVGGGVGIVVIYLIIKVLKEVGNWVIMILGVWIVELVLL